VPKARGRRAVGKLRSPQERAQGGRRGEVSRRIGAEGDESAVEPRQGRAVLRLPVRRRAWSAGCREATSRERERERLTRAPLVIAVVSRAAPHVKIPEWEQVLSAGAAAMSLVLAANALGYGANWITEWYAYDRAVLDALGLKPHERIAGFVHIGRPPQPTEDRPRPPLNEIATRFQA